MYTMNPQDELELDDEQDELDEQQKQVTSYMY